MDFLIEILMGLFFELPLEGTMESKTLKTWVKTAIWSVLMGIIVVLILISALDVWVDQNDPPRSICLICLALFVLVLTVVCAIWGHKHKWKQSN